ncbi:MAG: methyltransferase [Candidatus Lokiarchaeota archaeon]|nr:methyltransferase [Candidatus Lokiarchaeota archaeon]MBD3338846.1 methyltransferase [Candidatus Lokiarchaeota archaeon]
MELLEMNSRERILASFAHKEPDRVPIDIGATVTTGISGIAYYNLKKYLGIEEGHVRIIDLFQQLARVEDWFIDRFGIDALDVGRTFLTDDKDWYDVSLNGIEAQFPKPIPVRENPDGSFEVVHEDGTVLGRMSKDALVMDQTHYPYLEGYPEDISFQSFMRSLDKLFGAKVAVPPFTNLGERRFWRNLRERAIDLREQTQKITAINLSITIFQGTHSYRRMDKLLTDTIRQPQNVEKLVRAFTDFYLNNLKVICKYLGDVVDIINFGDDLGENNGPMLSPRTYRNLIKPAHAELCDYIKKHSSMKIFFHSCGSILPLIPDLIEIGVDILNPVQINARDMDPKTLKEEFGDELTFWGGGVDTRNILPRGSPEKVKKHVKNLLEIFAPGGGYVWNPIHNILADVPPQNIVAMLDAVRQYEYD